jgi:hypothetical protein
MLCQCYQLQIYLAVQRLIHAIMMILRDDDYMMKIYHMII